MHTEVIKIRTKVMADTSFVLFVRYDLIICGTPITIPVENPIQLMIVVNSIG
jgi:hypothetical protein